jgi:two-component system LytT family sensor kinase
MLFDLSSLLSSMAAVAYLLLVSGRIILIMALVYNNLIILLPVLYNERRGYYWICFFISLFMFCVLSIGFNNLFGLSELTQSGRITLVNLSISFFVGIRLLFLSSILKLSVDWYDQQTKIHQLEFAGLQSEVSLLKSQLNPHFLFNTLNNLQSLIIKKSSKAVQLVENLSDIMDYMLYDSQLSFLPLVNEIKYLKNYLDLERLRKPDSAKITIEITGDIESYTIAPLLMLPLVENAIKHGLNKVERDGFIDVKIEVISGILFLIVRNNTPENIDISKDGGGIGLSNMLRRLELLYSGKYFFETQYKDHNHIALLKLNLI